MGEVLSTEHSYVPGFFYLFDFLRLATSRMVTVDELCYSIGIKNSSNPFLLVGGF